MDTLTFQASVTDEQLIRPPTDVRLPCGTFEVTIRPAIEIAPRTSAALANDRLRQCRVKAGAPTGIDNEGIDADLARLYGNGVGSASPTGTR